MADEVVRKCDAQSTLDKISYVYNYLCDNVSYDTSYEAGSIYDALVGGRTVCSGYASAFQVMMEKMGGGGHMNIAGAQVKASPDEVERILKDIIDQEYQEENTK